MFTAFRASSFSRNAHNGIQAMTWSRRLVVVLSSRRLGFDPGVCSCWMCGEQTATTIGFDHRISNSPPYPFIHSFIYSYIHLHISDHLCILIVCLCLTTLTEVFPCFFLSCKANARVKTRKDGARPALFLIFVLFYVLFVLCRSVYCLCVNVYYTTATGWLPKCS
jgi:hypothetical protein